MTAIDNRPIDTERVGTQNSGFVYEQISMVFLGNEQNKALDETGVWDWGSVKTWRKNYTLRVAFRVQAQFKLFSWQWMKICCNLH